MKRLTSQEIHEKQDKGLYFYCDEKYAADHKCQPQKILRFDIMPESDSEEPRGTPEEEEVDNIQTPIELYARSMVGVVGVSSIRLVRKNNGQGGEFPS